MQAESEFTCCQHMRSVGTSKQPNDLVGSFVHCFWFTFCCRANFAISGFSSSREAASAAANTAAAAARFPFFAFLLTPPPPALTGSRFLFAGADPRPISLQPCSRRKCFCLKKQRKKCAPTVARCYFFCLGQTACHLSIQGWKMLFRCAGGEPKGKVPQGVGV